MNHTQLFSTDPEALLNKLEQDHRLTVLEYEFLLDSHSDDFAQLAAKKANQLRHKYYDNTVYMRGLIEFTNYCKNDCYYCGIRHGNKKAERYRLSEEEILECCEIGYELGFRTFVLQGGEDPFFTTQKLGEIIQKIKTVYPDCAITLSFGEHPKESYAHWRKMGANRYLLRHETANPEHYSKLHPNNLTLSHRQECLWNLKELGYQVGTGFMVGSPGQTNEYLAQDLSFIQELQPQMVGIGPFLPHHDTPFAQENKGSLETTTYLLSLLRLMLPNALLPSTTALGTIHPNGREMGIQAGANVVMPNLSPLSVRNKYMLYDDKICTGDEAAECRCCMQNRMRSIGYEVVVDRGDVKAL